MATATRTSGPALRLVGIVGFLVSATGLLYLRIGAARGLLRGQRRHPRPAGRASRCYSGFGPVGGNLFLLALLLISVTLATGLSWLTVMDKHRPVDAGARSAAGKLFRRGSQQATEWQQTRAFREEREEARKVDTELRAKRAPVQDRAAAGAGRREERPRQARAADPAVPRRRRHAASRRWRCSTIPSRSPRATARKRWKRCRGRSNSSSRTSASTRRWSAPIRAR